MNNYVYADTDSLSSFRATIRSRCESIIKSSTDFYFAVNNANWSDDISEHAIYSYQNVVHIAQDILTTIDGAGNILDEQLDDLQDYLSVNVSKR